MEASSSTTVVDRPYPFKRLSSPLTYSVLDSADSLDANDSSSERGAGHFSTFGHHLFSFDGRPQSNVAAAAIVDDEDASDIEFDYSPQTTPVAADKQRLKNTGLTVLPFSTDAAASTPEKHPQTQAESVRDSGLYSHSPSHSGEGINGGENATYYVQSQLMRAYPETSTMTTFGKSPPKDGGGGGGASTEGLIISPSAVSVRVATDHSHTLTSSSGMLDEDVTVSIPTPIVKPRRRSEAIIRRESESARQHHYETSVFPFPCCDIVTRETALQMFRSSRVGSPTNFRLIGRVTKMKAGSIHEVELHKPLAGTYGFYITKGGSQWDAKADGIYVSKFDGGYPEKFYCNVLGVGDRILTVNGVKVKKKSLDDVCNLMKGVDKLTLTVQPSLLRPQ
ncbi:uncharacterized protein [Oscarella lobularis]|uniref:uncharacterized protein n=1 Tax=Oscarella lobularis TaxID=121494 RepID=UPI003313A6A2